MRTKETTSLAPFAVVVVLVAALLAYLGWRVYDSPVDEQAAGVVAVRATDVVVRAGGGNSDICVNMRDVSTPDDAEDSVRRCQEAAAQAVSSGPGWLGVRDLRASEIDVGRSSGTVTVTGTLLTQGPPFRLTFTWPVAREDDAWAISGEPDVEVG